MAPNKRTFGPTVRRKGKAVDATIVYGTTEEFQKTSQIVLDDGRFMSELDVRAGRKVCIIGKDIAAALFPFESPINKDITISDVPMKVIGLLEKQGSGFLGSFSLDGQIIMPIKTFETIIGDARGRLRIDVKVGDVSKLEDVKQEIIAAMRVIRKIPPDKPDDFAINQQEVFKEMYDKTVGIIALAGIVITALSLFVGAIGIMNIMFVSVTERTREIGVRKAIGAKTWSILLQFLIESAVICLLPTSMPISIALLALLISAMVGIISGFLPAYKASRLNPVDSLRYE